MDEINDATNDNGQHQLQISNETSSIMSNLTAAAPITSQVVDDFQPDPKWEFTPLEKASLDCIEMEPSAFETINTEQSGDNMETSTKEQGEPGASDENEESARQDEQQQKHAPTDESKPHDRVIMEENSRQLVHEEQKIESRQNNSQHINVTGQKVMVEQEMEGPSGVVSEEIVGTAGIKDTNAATLIQSTDVGSATNIIKINECSTEQQETLIVSERNDQNVGFELTDASDHDMISDPKDDTPLATNPTYLSQTTVDAQMEKLIDNVVELGGGQNFEQTFGRSEDKAKVLESIHREITSDRSSMDIMADIALQQLPLLTEFINHPDTRADTETSQSDSIGRDNKSSYIEVKETAPSDESTKSNDLTEDNQGKLERNDKEIEAKQVESGQADHSKVEAAGDQATNIQETIETFVNEPSSDGSILVEPERTKPIVEVPQREESTADQYEAHAHQVLDASVTVDLVNQVDPQVKKIDIQPIVEATEKSDDENNTQPQKRSADDHNATTKTEASTKPHVNNASASKEPEVEKFGRRRSGRARAKQEEKEIETLPQSEIKDTPDRPKVPTRRGRKQEVLADEQPAEPPSQIDASKIEQPDEEDVENSRSEKEQVHEETAEPSEVALGMPVESKSARPTRVRIAKKPVDESPVKQDTIKRQVRKSRETDLNKTFEPGKNTPMIKLPAHRSRTTISTSDPATRPTPPSQKRKRSPSPDAEVSLGETEKAYACNECNFSTDRLNNMVFHYTKSYCPGKCQMVEDMKADIIKQQQTPKGNKNKRLAR